MLNYKNLKVITQRLKMSQYHLSLIKEVLNLLVQQKEQQTHQLNHHQLYLKKVPFLNQVNLPLELQIYLEGQL